MPYRPFDDQNCSIARALAVIGERWTLLVMREVLLGRQRFREIKRQTGIASNILADRLETLVEHDVLERRALGEHSEAVEYFPTERGLAVTHVLNALMTWGDRYVAPDGAPRVVVHTVCGHDADPQPVCAHCGARVRPDELRVRPGPGADERQRAEPLLPAI